MGVMDAFKEDLEEEEEKVEEDVAEDNNKDANKHIMSVINDPFQSADSDCLLNIQNNLENIMDQQDNDPL